MNPILYPPDYSSATDPTTAQFFVENAVTLLQTQAASTAAQQSLTRRELGQGVAAASNQTRFAKSGLMPLSSVGPKTVIPSGIQGTVAYLAGGRTHGTIDDGARTKSVAFFFSNESAIPEGFSLGDARLYCATLFNQSSGYWALGYFYKPITTLEKLSYSQGSIKQIGFNFAVPKLGSVGVGDAVKGVIAGGAVFPTVFNSTNQIEVLTYATDAVTPSGSALQTARFSPHGGTSHGGFGWIYGGSAKGHDYVGNLILSIDKISFSNYATSLHGQQLQFAHLVHSCAGNSRKAFIAAGANTNTSGWFTDSISRLDYTTGAVSVLGATLSEGKVCADGTGSSYAMYSMGGETAAGAAQGWIGSRKIDRIIYSSEASSLIGAELPAPMADQGAVCDYASSFS